MCVILQSFIYYVDGLFQPSSWSSDPVSWASNHESVQLWLQNNCYLPLFLFLICRPSKINKAKATFSKGLKIYLKNPCLFYFWLIIIYLHVVKFTQKYLFFFFSFFISHKLFIFMLLVYLKILLTLKKIYSKNFTFLTFRKL